MSHTVTEDLGHADCEKLIVYHCFVCKLLYHCCLTWVAICSLEMSRYHLLCLNVLLCIMLGCLRVCSCLCIVFVNYTSYIFPSFTTFLFHPIPTLTLQTQFARIVNLKLYRNSFWYNTTSITHTASLIAPNYLCALTHIWYAQTFRLIWALINVCLLKRERNKTKC